MIIGFSTEQLLMKSAAMTPDSALQLQNLAMNAWFNLAQETYVP